MAVPVRLARVKQVAWSAKASFACLSDSGVLRKFHPFTPGPDRTRLQPNSSDNLASRESGTRMTIMTPLSGKKDTTIVWLIGSHVPKSSAEYL
jgi:hypothetical protein